MLGWIFPVEGLIDYVYDDYASQPAHKRPPLVITQQKQVTIDINDLTLEDLEVLEKLFKQGK